ncbi:hypothetical protein OIU79_001045 [Salix purpurea]|uniref:Uncharacterized protein n=1 Tax=Salix purpurea TaxID=77065 RepID=A0A9Q0ZNN9_SALPP|nr:hypothetical protein OIU79_001045 [Salix purpurea]
MVCQAASQTRFRALKHENGSAGKPTIIVRVIACYQPLQDCQAEYFRHLLKPKEAEINSTLQIKAQFLVILLVGWLRLKVLGCFHHFLLGNRQTSIA